MTTHSLCSAFPDGLGWMAAARRNMETRTSRGWIYQSLSEDEDPQTMRDEARRRGFGEEFDALYFKYLAVRRL